jgi:hypothetical protein
MKVARDALMAALTLSLGACVAASCDEARLTSSPVEPNRSDSVVVPLDLQVRNNGLRGGYVWLGMADQPNTGRWHPFGMAQFMCVTCPRPFVGAGTGYEIVVLDESCAVRARQRTVGGQLLFEIDLGPTFELIPAPPIGDWLPEDSPPADAAGVPCRPPS